MPMDPLESLLRPLASILNRNIQQSTPARELCQELSGTVVAVRVSRSALAASFIVADDMLSVSTDSDKDPDVVIEGTLLTLARLAGSAREAAIRDGSLSLSGDAERADQFQRLLTLAKPDLEEELSSVVGDVAAHQLGEMARGFGRWSRAAKRTIGQNIREYLQEESRDAPSRYEVDQFATNVSTLRDDVARVEARLNRLRNTD